MSGASEIVLWLEEEKLSALRERNISVEAELQAALETLYCRSVPQAVREEIQKRLDTESARQKTEREAQTVWAVYHVIEHGEEQYCRTSQPDELLTAANRLRFYLRKEPASRPTRFSNLLPTRQEIPREVYDSLIKQRWKRLLDRLDGRELTPDTKLDESPEAWPPGQSDVPAM